MIDVKQAVYSSETSERRMIEIDGLTQGTIAISETDALNLSVELGKCFSTKAERENIEFRDNSAMRAVEDLISYNKALRHAIFMKDGERSYLIGQKHDLQAELVRKTTLLRLAYESMTGNPKDDTELLLQILAEIVATREK